MTLREAIYLARELNYDYVVFTPTTEEYLFAAEPYLTVDGDKVIMSHAGLLLNKITKEKIEIKHVQISAPFIVIRI